MKQVATNVTSAVIPESGHWIMEENPKAAIATLTTFIEGR